MPTILEILNQGVQLHQAGRLDQAEAVYRQVLQLDPNQPHALHLLGVIAHQQHDNTRAAELIRRAIALLPNEPQFHYNLGNVCREAGGATALAEAVHHYQQAIRLLPNYPDAHHNLGMAFYLLGKPDEAVAAYQQALQLNPNDAETYNNLGNALAEQGKWPDAIAHYREALRLRPGYAQAHYNLGNALRNSGGNAALPDAVAQFEEALRLDPQFAEAYNNLANVLQEEGLLAEALAGYREAIRLRPDYVEAHSNLLFCLGHDPAVSTAELLAEHRRWAIMHAGRVQTGAAPVHEHDLEHRLRIGYVSPDFRRHVVALSIEPVLAAHDRTRFEVYCYADVARPDAVTERLKQHADAWCSIVGWTDEQVAERIRQDRIDILVDLAGHSAHHRLLAFARRPAPIQATYLGFPGTTGLTAMNYRLSDAVLDPPNEPTPGPEEVVRLPRGWYCYAPHAAAPDVTPLPARRSGQVTFGSLNRLSKINEAVIKLWSDVLRAVPTSRLLLFPNILTSRARTTLEKRFASLGIASDRLHILTERPTAGHLSVYGDIDLSLDTFPWGGGTTSLECLWMGVPLVTLRGDRPSARLGASVLTSVGLPELIADSPEHFVRLAVELANDLDRLADLRATLRERMRKTLCDAEAFTRALEAEYRKMWHAQGAREPRTK